MIYLSLAVSAIFLVSAYLAYRSAVQEGGRLTAFLLGGLLATAVSAALNFEVLATALLLIVAGIICRAVRTSAARFAMLGTAFTLVVYAGYGVRHWQRFLAWQRVRQENPIESLADRLEYERLAVSRRGPSESSPDSVASSSDSPRPRTTLDTLENVLDAGEWRWGSRFRALHVIHSSYVNQFINSPGFGVTRGMPMLEPEKYAMAKEPRVFRLPPGEFIDLEGSPATGPSSDAENAVEDGAIEQADLRTGQLETLHEAGMFDFINQQGWGYVQDRDRVAGFQPHQFRRIPIVPATAQRSQDTFNERSWSERFVQEEEPPNADQNWVLRKLQLVSLLKQREPSVYVTDELPRMDRLVDIPVRPLDAFEQVALRSLEEESKEVVTDSPDANHMRMLGAIRAAKQCLKCHFVERGDLLGAFSYTLERTKPVRLPRENRPAF